MTAEPEKHVLINGKPFKISGSTGKPTLHKGS